MKIGTSLVLAGVFVLGGIAASGCGSSDTTTGAGGTGPGPASSASDSATTGTGGMTSSSTTGSATGGGGSGTGGAAPATCMGYCTTIMAGCTAALQQYPDMATCLENCADFPAGMPGDMNDSLECRNYHAGVAAMSATNAMTHCVHAGPTGGPGTCGEYCEGFCDIALVACSALTEYKDKASCMTECAKIPKPAMGDQFDVSDTNKNDQNCRMYHLEVASQSMANAMIHCPHTTVSEASQACTM